MYGLGEYTPDYLSTENGSNLINETFRVLNEGVNLGLSEQVDEAFKAKLEDSVFNFSGFKTNKELEEVNSLLRDENGNLRPFDQFKQDVLKLNDKYNLNYLQAEYNMAVQSAQMASKWQDFEAHKDFVNLQYRTAGDEKVRAEHAALDGTTLPVEDKFWSEYLPPLGWNCRCTVVEVLKDKHPESNSDEAIKAGAAATSQPSQKIFRFNPGKTGEVFPPKHPYYKVGGVNGKRVKQQVKREDDKRHYVNELNTTDYSEEVKKAIANNNLEVEDALKIKKGEPMSIAEADKQSANPKLGNKEYNLNCQVCTAAYLLRKRGFNVHAQGPDTILMEHPFLKWNNIDGSMPKVTTWAAWAHENEISQYDKNVFLDFFNTNCKSIGTYEVIIQLKKQKKWHATIIERTEDGLLWIDPQNQNVTNGMSIDTLCSRLNPEIIKDNDFGILRIDDKLIDPYFVTKAVQR